MIRVPPPPVANPPLSLSTTFNLPEIPPRDGKLHASSSSRSGLSCVCVNLLFPLFTTPLVHIRASLFPVASISISLFTFKPYSLILPSHCVLRFPPYIRSSLFDFVRYVKTRQTQIIPQPLDPRPLRLNFRSLSLCRPFFPACSNSGFRDCNPLLQQQPLCRHSFSTISSSTSTTSIYTGTRRKGKEDLLIRSKEFFL